MMDRWPASHCFDAGNKKLPILRPLLLVRLAPLSAMRTIDSSGLRKWTPCAGDLSFGNPKSSLHTPLAASITSSLPSPLYQTRRRSVSYTRGFTRKPTLVCVNQGVAVISIAPIRNEMRMPFPLYGNAGRCSSGRDSSLLANNQVIC